jgi:hypothetical protein
MWIEAIVMPREEQLPYRPSPQRDRRALHQAACTESLRFRDSLVKYLQAQKLMGQVKWMSEPGSLPLVTLRCHERVLERLRQAPEFEAGRSLSMELPS